MKLKLYKKEVTVDEDTIEISELQDILNKDSKIGTNALIYIFLYKDESVNNPLRDLPYNDREKESRKRMYGSSSYSFVSELGQDWATLIEKGVQAYPISEEQLDIYTYNKKIDELNELLEETEPKIRKNINVNTDVISFSTNISIINSILKDIINIIQAKASLVSLYMKGSIPKHLRGGLSPLSKQKLKVHESE